MYEITHVEFLAQGYFCCKRRVLEFEEFLKIEGCAEGRHLFVPKSKAIVRDTRAELTTFAGFADILAPNALPSQQAEETVNCRIDHYQTPSTVYVTVFAKQTDKGRSSVKIEDNEVTDRTAIRHSSNIKLTCADSP